MKNLLLILSIVFFINFTHAQSIDGYGIKAGFGLTNHNWEYNISDDPFKLTFDDNSGIALKLFADIDIAQYIQVESEIGFQQKGAKYKIDLTSISQPDGTGETRTINNRLNYLSLSVIGKFKYTINSVSPYILLGPEYSYLLSKQIDEGFDIVYDKFKKNTFGFSLGVGSELLVSQINYIIEYRYSKDFTNNYNSSRIDIKNYSHTIFIGVKI